MTSSFFFKKLMTGGLGLAPEEHHCPFVSMLLGLLPEFPFTPCWCPCSCPWSVFVEAVSRSELVFPLRAPFPNSHYL